MRQNETICPKKAPQFFICEKCDYTSCNKKDYNRHLMTRKHRNETGMRQNETFTCEFCSLELKSRATYYRHKQMCRKYWGEKNPQKKANEDMVSPDNPNPDLVMMLLKQNQEFKELLISKNNQMMEMCKHMGSHNTSINHTNSHNKTFNLQFFLNETCKDAMNITDFVDSLKLTLKDLESVGELGYAEGISRVFVKGLNELDVTKRPIHCSDIKREVLHIKDHDAWEKDENKERLTKAIKDVSTKNLMLLTDWQRENPGCTEYNHSKNDMYLKIMTESCGPTDATTEKRDVSKIIKKVAKTTIIDREN